MNWTGDKGTATEDMSRHRENTYRLEMRLRAAKDTMQLARRALEAAIKDQELIVQARRGRQWHAVLEWRVARRRLALENAIREYQLIEGALRQARAR